MPADVSISFPHLGIDLENLGQSISLFGVDIAYYGIIIGFGMIVAMIVAFRDARLTGQSVDDYVDLAIFGIVFAIIGARLYYVIFEWEFYKDNLLEIFNFRAGGLAIYGGIIGGVLTCIVLAKIKKLSVWKMMDTGCLGLITGQMIGRWGNFFNREAYGGNTDSLFAMRINLDDPNVLVEVQEGVTIVNDSYIQVHPTFLYESFWCMCILIGLQLFKRRKKFDGEVFLWYISMYGLGRFFIEGLRTDQLRIQGTEIAVSQVLSAILLVVGLFFIVLNRVRISKGQETFLIGKVGQIQKAMSYAKEKHQGQTWTVKNGNKVSYYKGHLLGVYGVLAGNEGVDEEVLLTALLHDIMEDTSATYEEIEKQFGEKVAENVKWLTRSKGASYYEYIDTLLARGSDAAVIVKLADRQFNTINLMNIGDKEWHEKKLKQADYMLTHFKERDVAESYRNVKEKMLAVMEKEVEKYNRIV